MHHFEPLAKHIGIRICNVSNSYQLQSKVHLVFEADDASSVEVQTRQSDVVYAKVATMWSPAEVDDAEKRENFIECCLELKALNKHMGKPCLYTQHQQNKPEWT